MTIKSILRRSFINPFSIILFILATVSFITDWIFSSKNDLKTARKEFGLSEKNSLLKKVLLRFSKVLIRFIAVLVPEMIPMVVNACLAHSSSMMGKKQPSVKRWLAKKFFLIPDYQ